MDSKSWDKNYVVQSRRFNFRTFNVGFKDQLYMLGDSISYDPSRGSFETFDMFPGDVCHACSFRQKIYALIKPFGLMRYDEEDQWKQIVGWSENLEAALMGVFNEKLVVLKAYSKEGGNGMQQIRMTVYDEDVSGAFQEERSIVVGQVPLSYDLKNCVSILF